MSGEKKRNRTTDDPKNGQPKTSTNPKGAGRPRKESAPPPPPSPEDEALQAEADELRSMKFTPTVCRAIGQQLAGFESLAYSVTARVLDDERWKLDAAEVEAQEKLITIGLLVYAERIPAVLVPIVLVLGLTAPLVARVAMPAPEKSNLGAPKPKAAA